MNSGILLSTLLPAQQAQFLKYAEAYGNAYLKGNEHPDARLSTLPHHQRIALHDAVALEARFIETFAPAVIEAAKYPGSTRQDIARTMLREYPLLAETVYQGRFDVLCDISLRLMTHLGRIRVFQTTDALEAMLHQTDFGDDIPASWFQPPFKDIYIEFGEGRHFPLTMSDPQSGRHIIEGCYLLSGQSHPIGSQGPLVRGFDMIIFGSPVGKSGIMDDCFVHMGLPIESETVPISEVVRRVVDHYAARADFPNADIFRPVIEHVAKVLVYLGTREARQRDVNDGKTVKLKLASLKSTAKREKTSRQAARLYDRIVVGPDALPAELSKGAPGRSGMKAHIRRGHFRSQAYGPQHSLRRPQWLQPTLVGQSQLAANGTQAAYEIR